MFGFYPISATMFFVKARSITSESSIEAREFELRDTDYRDAGRFGYMTGGKMHPKIAIEGKDAESFEVSGRYLRLESDRGTVILELNEKGEPVLRSIPAKK